MDQHTFAKVEVLGDNTILKNLVEEYMEIGFEPSTRILEELIGYGIISGSFIARQLF